MKADTFTLTISKDAPEGEMSSAHSCKMICEFDRRYIVLKYDDGEGEPSFVSIPFGAALDVAGEIIRLVQIISEEEAAEDD